MPDYQGVGLGTNFLNAIAEHYSKMGYDFSITTSAKNLILALKRSDRWMCSFFGTVKKKVGIHKLRIGVKMGSFFYRKGKEKNEDIL